MPSPSLSTATDRTRGLFRDTDIVVVNYVAAGAVDDGSEDTIHVRASKPNGESPSRDAASDVEQLLDRCGKL